MARRRPKKPTNQPSGGAKSRGAKSGGATSAGARSRRARSSRSKPAAPSVSRVTFIGHTLPGLERVAWTEISQRLTEAELDGFKSVQRRNGLVLFQYRGDPRALGSVRTLEDLFLCLHRLKPKWGYEGLSQIYESIVSQPWPPPVLGRHGPVAHLAHTRKLFFRVIVRMSGSKQPYRRTDLRRSIEKAIEKASHGHWRPTDDERASELWVSYVGQELLFALRLTDASARHRDYQEAHLPASLRPSVAAAMTWLSRPSDGDVFLDPLCGAGTIAIERALAGPFRSAQGGDLSEEAIEAALTNVSASGASISLARWDARALPLPPGSVTKIVTNPPFGVQLGNPAETPALYRELFREFARVLRPGGTLVTLTSRHELITSLLQGRPEYAPLERHAIQILGQRATIFVLRRTNRSAT